MNWLAHIFLSEPDPCYRVGNLLPDLLYPSQLAAVPEEFRAGIACHRFIDAYTDAHPIVRRSVQRFTGETRRFAGIVVDIIYDHFLAASWPDFHLSESLAEFSTSAYAAFAHCAPRLPLEATATFELIIAEDRFNGYRHPNAVDKALDRLAHRMRGRMPVAAILAEVEREYAALQMDFITFFPDLQRAVAEDFRIPQ